MLFKLNNHFSILFIYVFLNHFDWLSNIWWTEIRFQSFFILYFFALFVYLTSAFFNFRIFKQIIIFIQVSGDMQSDSIFYRQTNFEFQKSYLERTDLFCLCKDKDERDRHRIY